MQELKISEFSFHEFLEQFQAAVLDGYELDLESNERFPQKFGSHLEVTLVKFELTQAQTELLVTEVTPEALIEGGSIGGGMSDIPVASSQEEADSIVAEFKLPTELVTEVTSEEIPEVAPTENLVVAPTEQVTKTRKPKGS